MAEEQPKEKSPIGDLFGIKPISNAIEKTTDAGVEVVKELIQRICYPVAEEWGLFFKDKVAWRRENLRKVAEKAIEIIPENSSFQAHPRVLHEIIENASWADDEEVQAMWAGLLASSCTEDGKDDKNLIYIELLSKLTSIEACIINSICNYLLNNNRNRGVYRFVSLIDYSFEYNENDENSKPQQNEIVKIKPPILIKKIRDELSHLRSLGLITTSFSYIHIYPGYLKKNISLEENDLGYATDTCVTELAMLLYEKCHFVDNEN